MEREGTNLYKSSVIRIISDKSDEQRLYKIELLKFLILFGITILVVLLLTYNKTKVITDPIKKLVDNVNRITNGHLDERADVVGNNEIASLSEQFNVMIEQLESYYNELEEKVRERTYEIYQQKEEIDSHRERVLGRRAGRKARNRRLQRDEMGGGSLLGIAPTGGGISERPRHDRRAGHGGDGAGGPHDQRDG